MPAPEPMKNKRNYYRILHVQPDAPVELIKMSYRTIMQKLKKHPDLGGDEWDASVINEAYAVLSDKKLRAAYDARLLRERSMADAGQQSEEQRDDVRGANKQKAEHSAEAQEHAQQADEASEKAAEQPDEQASAQPGAQRTHSANDEQVAANTCFFCKATYQQTPGIDSDCATCASPLLKLNAEAMDQSGDRTIQRQPRNSPLDIWPFWPGAKKEATLVDLSLHGLKLRFTHPLQAGHVIKVETPAFTGVARVAHCVSADTGFFLGAQFLSLRFVSQSGTFVQTSA